MASIKAEGTAQKHVLLVRGEIEKLLPNPMDTISPVVPKTDKQWRELERIKPRESGWRYSRKAGQLCVQFENPILWDDVQQAFYDGLVKGGAHDSPFITKWDKKRAADKSAEGDSVGENTTGHKKGDVIVGTTRLLTKTSKMGCYSWNLPAGPLKYNGCCPGANMAFSIKGMKADGYRKYKEDELSELERMAHAVHASTQMASGYQSAIPTDPEEIKRKFICNGCYAMKGAYGNPSVITIMQWRYRWLRGFAIPSGQFVDAMVTAITMARAHSRKELKRVAKKGDPRKLAAVPHPDYFRIHDSGDMYTPEYFEQWLAVCKHKKMRDVHFWAPSRIWTSISMAEDLQHLIDTKKIPTNLCLRPSGLFFDGPEPHVPGLSGGTSSSGITFKVRRDGKVSLDITSTGPNTWGCPAYLPEVVGGGALEKLYKPPKEKKAPKKNPCCRMNPARQSLDMESYAMFPDVDDATPEEGDKVFYDAMYDKKKKRFIVDPATGRPMVANKTNIKKHPNATVEKSQAFQAAGSCTVARDPKHAAECRVCWGTSGHKRSRFMKSLPVVYGKH